MNNRIGTVVATAMLISLSSGCCSNMSNLWFGRGARCGLCNTLSSNAPRFGSCLRLPCRNRQQAPPCTSPQCTSPQCTAPYASAPYQGVQQAPQWQAPTNPSAPAGDCGCNGYAGRSDPQPHYGSAYGGDCNGECGVEGYGGFVHDPYLSSGSSSSTTPYEGQIIDGQPLPGNYAPIESDDFQSRKFDADGNKILWEEPLPAGSGTR